MDSREESLIISTWIEIPWSRDMARAVIRMKGEKLGSPYIHRRKLYIHIDGDKRTIAKLARLLDIYDFSIRRILPTDIIDNKERTIEVVTRQNFYADFILVNIYACSNYHCYVVSTLIDPLSQTCYTVVEQDGSVYTEGEFIPYELLLVMQLLPVILGDDHVREVLGIGEVVLI